MKIVDLGFGAGDDFFNFRGAHKRIAQLVVGLSRLKKTFRDNQLIYNREMEYIESPSFIEIYGL